jgi:Mrp family chromosome partitioning ATPase
LTPDVRDWVKAKARGVMEKLSGVEKVNVEFVESTPQELNQIRYIIAVLSGKGGVGKSLVASLLAIALNRQGYEVGILDADITGPSIPKIFGIAERPTGSESGIMPVQSRSGIEVMSINLLLPHEDDAVIWRGPLIGKAIQQFWNDVIWGRLDFLFVDLPPGTADASLTVMQSIPLSGVVIVSTPQELAGMVVRKAVNMARQVNIPVLGVVENMSYFPLPEAGKNIEIFGKSKAEEMAKAASAPLLGKIPVDPEIARLCDEGWIERYSSDAFDALAQAFTKMISQR